MLLVWSFLFVASSFGLESSPDREYFLRHGFRKRSYLVHVPSSYRSGTPTPVVLNFHGGGGNTEGQMASSGMNETSNREGFLVVYPQGTGKMISGGKIKTWNAGRCCGYAKEHKIDDVGFAKVMLRELQQDFSIDSKRIYATGISNGGQMAYRLACELSDQIAAIAPVASAGVLDECRPSRPVPIIHFHGTADPTAFYQGGVCGGAYERWLSKLGFGGKDRAPSNTWKCQAIPDYMVDWKNRNGCTEAGQVTYQKGGAKCMQYGGCDENADVVLCSISGGGHTWPGGSHGLVCKNENSRACKTFSETVGPISRDISANDTMWQFFKKHSL